MHDPIRRQVIPNDLCIGCGACTVSLQPHITMQLGDNGQYRPVFHSEPDAQQLAAAARVCPFSGETVNEDQIATALYGQGQHWHHPAVGYGLAVHVGHAGDTGYRQQGSAGGLTSWLLSQLFAADEIDAVIGVGPLAQSDQGTIHGYRIITTAAELSQLAGSKYYPITLGHLLPELPAARYALVGLPCFIKAARLLAREQPERYGQIRYTLALACGHLKSRHFADYLAWQQGIAPHELRNIDFRVKRPGYPANRYAIAVTSDTHTASKPAWRLRGTDWGEGCFKHRACDYCDDIAGETADITLGDAWLPQCRDDWRGHNILLTRSPRLEQLLQRAAKDGTIHLQPASVDDFLQAQAPNYRHRREALAGRIHRQQQAGHWLPQKRIPPAPWQSPRQRHQQQARETLREQSPKLFTRALHQRRKHVYERAIFPLQWRYHWHAGNLLRFLIKWLLAVRLRR